LTNRATDDPLGVLLVSADEVMIGEWSPRRVEELERHELPLTDAVETELLGPSYAHPRGSGEKATAARSSSQRDLWERRLEDHRVRFARSVAADTAKIAKTRGWDAVLVLGDPRRAGPASEELDRAGVRAVPIASVLDWMRPAALAKRLAHEVEKVRAEVPRRGARR
jgi:hypothetical protein